MTVIRNTELMRIARQEQLESWVLVGVFPDGSTYCAWSDDMFRANWLLDKGKEICMDQVSDEPDEAG